MPLLARQADGDEVMEELSDPAVIATVAVAVQPPAELIITLYDVFEVGETDIEVLVAPVLQK